MSLETRAALNAYADAEFTTNGVGAITGADLNEFAKDISDSAALKSETAEVSLAMLENRAQATLLGRAAGAGTGAPQELTPTQAKALLAIAAADVSGLSAFATSTDLANATGTLDIARIADGSVTLAKLANLAQSTIIGRASGAGTGVPTALTATQVKTLLAIAASDVSGLAAIATSGSASDLTTGTVPDARIAGAYTGITKLTSAGVSSLFDLFMDTADAADTKGVRIAGGGATGATRGAALQLFGNEHANNGLAQLTAGEGNLVLVGGTDSGVSVNIRNATADGADTGFAQITGGGAFGATRGGLIAVYGNEHATFPGEVRITPGTGFAATVDGALDVTSTVNVQDALFVNNDIEIFSGGIFIDTGGIFAVGAIESAGALIGASVDTSGAINAGGNLSTESILFYSGAGTNFDIRHVTSDGSDSRAIRINAGGGIATTRGAQIQLFGNEHASFPGDAYIQVASGSSINLSGATNINGTLVNTGNFGGFLFGTKTFDPPSTLNNATTTTTVTVTGAAVGDLALATQSTWANGWIIMARVTSANTVTVYMTNATGGTSDLGSGTLNVMVFKVPP